jgi:hypothetical protein
MRVLLASIRTCPLAVTAVSLGSLVLLLIKIVWLNQLPASFSLAPSLGVLLEGLLSATLAAYVFFVLSVQLPQVLERRRLSAFVVARAESVANGVMGFLQMIAGSTEAGVLDQSRVDWNTVTELFSKVSLSADAPMKKAWKSADAPMKKAWNLPQLSWLGAMAYHDELRLEESDRLLQLGRFLDSELVALLYEIEDSPHSAGMRNAREILLPNEGHIQNASLQAWAKNYYECYQVARRLREYCERFRLLYDVQRAQKRVQQP